MGYQPAETAAAEVMYIGMTPAEYVIPIDEALGIVAERSQTILYEDIACELDVCVPLDCDGLGQIQDQLISPWYGFLHECLSNVVATATSWNSPEAVVSIAGGDYYYRLVPPISTDVNQPCLDRSFAVVFTPVEGNLPFCNGLLVQMEAGHYDDAPSVSRELRVKVADYRRPGQRRQTEIHIIQRVSGRLEVSSDDHQTRHIVREL